jgi:predicted metal-dependent HD superfamily phosphohydrolase
MTLYNDIHSLWNYYVKDQYKNISPYNFYIEPHRFYHNKDHLELLFSKILHYKHTNNYVILGLTTIFHDIVYNPRQNNNEERSAQLFLEYINHNLLSAKDLNQIYQNILDTKDLNISNEFNDLDREILTSNNIKELLDYEYKIFQEYKFLLDYNHQRLTFLKSIVKNYPNIQKLINHLEPKNMKTA